MKRRTLGFSLSAVLPFVFVACSGGAEKTGTIDEASNPTWSIPADWNVHAVTSSPTPGVDPLNFVLTGDSDVTPDELLAALAQVNNWQSVPVGLNPLAGQCISPETGSVQPAGHSSYVTQQFSWRVDGCAGGIIDGIDGSENHARGYRQTSTGAWFVTVSKEYLCKVDPPPFVWHCIDPVQKGVSAGGYDDGLLAFENDVLLAVGTKSWWFQAVDASRPAGTGEGGVPFGSRLATWTVRHHAPAQPPPSQNPCAKVPTSANGVYCGRTTQFGFEPKLANAGTLYTCTGGATTKTFPCAGGCNIAPAGMADSCASADPCANVSNADNGVYCGRSNQAGFNSGKADAKTLYTCTGGATSHKSGCPSGCSVAAAGSPDSCVASLSSDPCARVTPADNGVYCGISNQAGFNSSKADFKTLYTCTNGVTTHKSACGNGCTVATPGSPDSCSNSTDPCGRVASADNGVYCGASSQAGFNATIANIYTLYTCTNGRTSRTTDCGDGCFVAPAGSPDGCSNSTDPCAQVTADGLYCGTSTQASFNPGAADPNSLYTCKRSVASAAQFCLNGCFVASAGVSDGCN